MLGTDAASNSWAVGATSAQETRRSKKWLVLFAIIFAPISFLENANAQIPFGPDGCRHVVGEAPESITYSCESKSAAFRKVANHPVPPDRCGTIYGVPNGRVLVRDRGSFFYQRQQCLYPDDPSKIWGEITISVGNHPQQSQPLQPAKTDGKPECCGVGNPINIATGEKFEEVVDLPLGGMLSFARYYGSKSSRSDIGLGPRWTYSFSRRIVLDGNGVANVTRDDNKMFQFRENTTTAQWVSDTDVTYRLSETPMGWALTTPVGDLELYDAAGKLQEIRT